MSSLRIALLASMLSVVGCGSVQDVDLSALPVADEEADAKADSAASAYIWVRPAMGLVRCVAAPCESHLLRGLGGVGSRLVYAVDLRTLRLSEERQMELLSRMDSMLLRGRLINFHALGRTVKVFQVTRAYDAVSESAADRPEADHYYSMKPVQCIKAPCNLIGQPISGGSSATLVAGLDLSPLGLPAPAQAALYSEIVAGTAVVSVAPEAQGQPRVTQAFRSFRLRPLSK